MREFFLLIILFFCVKASGIDLITKSGKIYKNYKVSQIKHDGIFIVHHAGTATIPWAALPEDVKALYWSRRRSDIQSVNNTAPNGKTIHTGPRGGRYYYNKKGKKVYLKR